MRRFLVDARYLPWASTTGWYSLFTTKLSKSKNTLFLDSGLFGSVNGSSPRADCASTGTIARVSGPVGLPVVDEASTIGAAFWSSRLTDEQPARTKAKTVPAMAARTKR